mgnify:CR=1 FL=1
MKCQINFAKYFLRLRAVETKPKQGLSMETVLAKAKEQVDAPRVKKVMPKVTESSDRPAYEAMQEEKLRAMARAYPDTGVRQGAKGRAEKARTAAKIEAFEAHKAAKLAMRAAGFSKLKTRMKFGPFFARFKDSAAAQRAYRAKKTKAAKATKKRIVKKSRS